MELSPSSAGDSKAVQEDLIAKCDPELPLPLEELSLCPSSEAELADGAGASALALPSDPADSRAPLPV